MEAGYEESPLGGPTKPMLYSSGLLFPALAAGASFEGLLQLYPLPITDPNTTAGSSESAALGGNVSIAVASFGWADAYVVPASPGSASANFTRLTQVFRGLHRHGPPVVNDATNDTLDALGDAFTCPCPLAAAAAVAEESGLPVPLFTQQAGTISEAEGVYVHDFVQCTWRFDYSVLLDWTLITITPTIPPSTVLLLSSGPEKLTATANTPPPPGALPDIGCFGTPCNHADDARTGATALLSLPAVISFEANSTRMLPARRSAGGIGRFSLEYEQYGSLPNSFALRYDKLQGQFELHAAQMKSTRSTVSALGQSGGRPWHFGLSQNAEVRTKVNSESEPAPTNPLAGPLLLSLSTFPGSESPCRFARGPTSEVIR